MPSIFSRRSSPMILHRFLCHFRRLLRRSGLSRMSAPARLQRSLTERSVRHCNSRRRRRIRWSRRASIIRQLGSRYSERGDAAEATRYGSQAATIAEAAGAYDAASAASTVLYETAADLRDDVSEAASHLSRVALNSARCNNIEMQLFAAVGKFELAMERGDDGDAIVAQAELENFDLQYSSHIVSEAFLAAQVLRATWAGDFRRAYATLASSADLQWTADRSALRWAEIATYATAAGLTDVGRRAAISALRKLRGAPPSLRGTRAKILCSLAYSLLGRRKQARAILVRACAREDCMSARLEHLAIAVDHVASFHSGAANYGEVIMAIDRLHQHNFGGLARMLEALPTPRLRVTAAAASCWIALMSFAGARTTQTFLHGSTARAKPTPERLQSRRYSPASLHKCAEPGEVRSRSRSEEFCGASSH